MNQNKGVNITPQLVFVYPSCIENFSIKILFTFLSLIFLIPVIQISSIEITVYTSGH